MLSNKIVTAGVVVVIILAAVYIGNQVIRTTPQSGALGAAQYKVVNDWNLQGGMEDVLNNLSKDGWEFVGVGEGSLFFKKR